MHTHTQSEPPRFKLYVFFFYSGALEPLPLLDKKTKRLKNGIETSKTPEFEPLSPIKILENPFAYRNIRSHIAGVSSYK